MVKITDVLRRSRAWRAGLRPDDELVAINGNEVRDVLDYRFYLAEKAVCLTCRRAGQAFDVTIHKDMYDDIGLCFETPLMDQKNSCRNGCIFCFIDQLPKGMRESLYFKDDDSRLSFLHGNYITLTNMTEQDIDRIVRMRFSPINISVHTTNPELRVKMMKNKRAGQVLSYLDRLKEAGLTMRGQIVLCRGINDGGELDRSLADLAKLFPQMDSVSVVPAGLTDHREGLYPLEPFTAEESAAVIAQVNAFGDAHLQRTGSRMFYVSDEFYLKAGMPLPDADYYEEYSQIENGVGMLRSFGDEFADAMVNFASDLAVLTAEKGPIHVSCATGRAAYPHMCALAQAVMDRAPALHIHVYEIENRFFGTQVTVAGLLTGRDIAEQLQGKQLGRVLLLPRTTLRAEGDLFLCGMSCDGLSEALHTPIVFTENDGADFLAALLDAAEL